MWQTDSTNMFWRLIALYTAKHSTALNLQLINKLRLTWQYRQAGVSRKNWRIAANNWRKRIPSRRQERSTLSVTSSCIGYRRGWGESSVERSLDAMAQTANNSDHINHCHKWGKFYITLWHIMGDKPFHTMIITQLLGNVCPIHSHHILDFSNKISLL